jgi:hypothetical protein
MDIPVIYLLIILGYGLVIIGILLRNFAMTMLSCFLLFAVSIYTFKYGISVFAYNSFASIMFSAVTFGVAAYISARSGLEIIQ